VHVDGRHVPRREAVGVLQRAERVDGGGDLAIRGARNGRDGFTTPSMVRAAW
jgi:hypothetical protein